METTTQVDSLAPLAGRGWGEGVRVVEWRLPLTRRTGQRKSAAGTAPTSPRKRGEVKQVRESS
jgi:hypothetical protein